MSLTVSQGDGITVITVASNPKSKWPILCQILGTVCYSPVCSVPQGMKGKLMNTLTALGIVQIIVGVINIALGILFLNIWIDYYRVQGPFWLGGVFIAVGIVCILAAKFPSPCLLVITVILNTVSAALAITAVVLYSVDMTSDHSIYCADEHYSSYYYTTAPSPTKAHIRKTCLYHKRLYQMILGGLDIVIIVLSVLQLCVTVSFCVLTVKSMCKESEALKSVEEPQFYKPLLEDATASPAC